MSTVRKIVVAICCSDIHLSLKPPVARAREEDWLLAQARPLWQLKKIADTYDVPVLCAGDIFDRWNSPPELINYAIKHLPKMYAIPGQHDLPMHNVDSIHRSAYWTLVEAGIIQHIPNLENAHIGWGIELHGFPWGVELWPAEQRCFHNPTSHCPSKVRKNTIKVALIHQYIWTDGYSYPGAPNSGKIKAFGKNITGWDVVIVGDNHKGFTTRHRGVIILNCGGLQRRASDEIDYRPQVGLLYNDGTIEHKRLDVSADIIDETAKPRTDQEDMDLRDFLKELTGLQNSGLDFEEAMKQAIKTVRKPVREMILEAMQNE